MTLQLFEGPRLSLFIKDGKRFFPQTKTVCLLITMRILLRITRHQPTDGNKLNIHAVYKVEWVRLIYIGKITFTAVQQAGLSTRDTKVTRAGIFLLELD